ncbi:hypothetical protein ACTFIY_006466 [Dictyostelium cf. discoideum]
MYCGYIYKLGQFLYKKRYFEIIYDHDQILLENQQPHSSSPKLCYFDNENKKLKRGSIEIQDILYFNISKEYSYNHGNVFGFELTKSERIYWIEAITTISSKLKQNKIDNRINDNLESTNFLPQSPQVSIKNDHNENENDENFKINNKYNKNENKNNDQQINNEYFKETMYEIFNLIDNFNNRKIKLINYQNLFNNQIICNNNNNHPNENNLNQINIFKNQILETQFKIHAIICPLIKSELNSIKLFLKGSLDSNNFNNSFLIDNENKLLEILNENNNNEVEICEKIKISREQLIFKTNLLKEEINLSNNNYNNSSISNLNILFKKISKLNSNNNNSNNNNSKINSNNINNRYYIDDNQNECNEIKKCDILELFFNDSILNKMEEFNIIKEGLNEKIKKMDKKIINIENDINLYKNSNISSENQEPSELLVLLNELIDYNELSINHFNHYLNFIKQVLLLKSQCKNIKLQQISITPKQNNNISQLDLLVESLIKKHNNNNNNNNNTTTNNNNNGRCYSVGYDRSLKESIRSTSSLSNLSVSSLNTAPILNPSGKWVLPSNFKKISTGLYQFGSKRINASICDSDGNLIVRVGGGYLLFVDFVYKYGERESLKLKSQLKSSQNTI